MKKAWIIALGALAIGGVALAPQALAYRGDPNVKGPNYSEERHEAMIKAFENNDYYAWKSLMAGWGRMSEVINEGNFARFTEAHRLAMEGKTAEAVAIRQELGLGLHNGLGRGQGMGYGRMR